MYDKYYLKNNLNKKEALKNIGLALLGFIFLILALAIFTNKIVGLFSLGKIEGLISLLLGLFMLILTCINTKNICIKNLDYKVFNEEFIIYLPNKTYKLDLNELNYIYIYNNKKMKNNKYYSDLALYNPIDKHLLTLASEPLLRGKNGIKVKEELVNIYTRLYLDRLKEKINIGDTVEFPCLYPILDEAIFENLFINKKHKHKKNLFLKKDLYKARFKKEILTKVDIPILDSIYVDYEKIRLSSKEIFLEEISSIVIHRYDLGGYEENLPNWIGVKSLGILDLEGNLIIKVDLSKVLNATVLVSFLEENYPVWEVI